MIIIICVRSAIAPSPFSPGPDLPRPLPMPADIGYSLRRGRWDLQTALELVWSNWEGKTKDNWPKSFTKNSIIRNHNRDWSCEQAILILHDLRVDYITEQLCFYAMNGSFQCIRPIELVCVSIQMNLNFFLTLGKNHHTFVGSAYTCGNSLCTSKNYSLCG